MKATKVTKGKAGTTEGAGAGPPPAEPTYAVLHPDVQGQLNRIEQNLILLRADVQSLNERLDRFEQRGGKAPSPVGSLRQALANLLVPPPATVTPTVAPPISAGWAPSPTDQVY